MALIIERAAALGLGAIAITDHNSLEGAKEGAKLADGRLMIIPGAEIKTEIGDVLALFVDEPVSARQFLIVLDEIRAKGGISIIPHPGDSPRITAGDIRLADGVEIFNATCSRRSNEYASKIAAELNKPGFASSDAHLVMEIGNGRTRITDCATLEELRKTILQSPAPSHMVRSNTLLHRTNEAINFGLKGIWRR